MENVRLRTQGSSLAHALVISLVGALSIGALASLGDALGTNVAGQALTRPLAPTPDIGRSQAAAFGTVRRVVRALADNVAAPAFGARPATGSAQDMARTAAKTVSGGDEFVEAALRGLARGQLGLGQVRIASFGNGESRYFTNRLLSTLNCTECTIALDRRLSGADFGALADGASLDRFAAERGIEVGTGAMNEALSQPEIVRALTTADDEVPQLAALFRGETTFEELQATGRPTIERAVEALRAHDFEAHDAVWRGQKPNYTGLSAAAKREVRNAYRRSKYAVDKVRNAVRDVEELPHVQLMSRFTAQDYSLQEVAVRLGLDPNDIVDFSSPEARQWVQIPVWELSEDFGPTFLEIARRSRSDIEGVKKQIMRWHREVQDAAGWNAAAGPDHLGKRGALSFVAVDPQSGDVFAHVLNVVVPRRDTKAIYGGVGPYVVDSQLGHVYNLDDFFAYTYPKMIYAEFIETGDMLAPLPDPGVYRVGNKDRPVATQYSHGATMRNETAATQRQLYYGAQAFPKVLAGRAEN